MTLLKNWSRHIQSTWKEIVHEYFLPLLAEFLILILCMICFAAFVKIGPMIQEPEMLGEEMSKPTAGRLAYGVLSLILWYVCSCIASKAADKEKHYTSSLIGFLAGILLRQCIGEISWHFSVDGVHFVPLESVTTFPLACLSC